MEQLGDRFAAERRRLGYRTASAVAEAIKVSQAAISKIELGRSTPGGELLTAFADLGADVQYILTGNRVAQPNRTAFEALLRFRLDGLATLGGSTVGARFQTERMRLGLGVQETAALCRVTRNAIHKAERAGATPGGAVLAAFAAAGADIHFVLTGERRPDARQFIDAALAAYDYAQKLQEPR